MEWVKARLREASTWAAVSAGASAVSAYVGGMMPREAAISAIVAALLGVAMKDKGGAK